LLNNEYSTGIKKRVIKELTVRPPIKVLAMGCIVSVPGPGKKAMGTIARMVERLVINMGLNLVRPASRQASLTL
jgi:4-hydroxy-3-methylbut-2-en-1-yl diphosphate synthase IspG/GcpE